MTIQAVLFDLDGTLIDSAPDLGAAADQMRVQRGLPSLPYSAYRSVAGAGARGLLGVAFGMVPDHADYAAYCQEFLAIYEARMFEQTAAFDGVAPMLAQLMRLGVPWGIVTNKPARFAEPLARSLPDLHGAATVVSGDTTPFAKPHPEPLFEAARRMGVQSSRCLYVGDDKRDMLAAQAAGMPGMAALWGYLGEHAVEGWGADAVADQPHAVLHWLQQKGGA